MRNTTILLILLLFGLQNSFAQNNDVALFKRNVRKNFTWAIKPYNGDYQRYYNKYFDYNKLSYPSRINYIRINDPLLKKRGSNVAELLNVNKIPQQIFYKLFSVNDQFSLDNISRLAKNNMTDAEAIQFSATSVGVKGSAERAYFYDVLSNNYVCITSVYDVHTQEEEYNRIDKRNLKRERREARDNSIKPANKYKFRPVVRNKTGYLCQISLQMYKIKLDSDEAIAKFEKAIFEGEKTDADKLNAIMNYNYPIGATKLSTSVSAKSVDYKETAKRKGYGADYFLSNLFKFRDIDKKIDKMLKEDKTFVTKESVYNTQNGIQAKIGTKEGLETNLRFLVYEQVIDKKGKKKAKKVGAVRVKGKPANNRGIASGHTKPSNFYQIQGKKIHKGMMLVEKNTNMNIGFGYGNGFFNFEFAYLPNMMTSTWIFVKIEGGNVPLEEKEVNTFYYVAGLKKDLHFAQNFYLQLNAAVGYESAKFTKDYEEYNEIYQIAPEDKDLKDMGRSNLGFVIGSKLGMYISSGVNIYAGIENSSFSYPEESIFSGGVYKSVVLDRHPTRLQFGINFEL